MAGVSCQACVQDTDVEFVTDCFRVVGHEVLRCHATGETLTMYNDIMSCDGETGGGIGGEPFHICGPGDGL